MKFPKGSLNQAISGVPLRQMPFSSVFKYSLS
jgi:hypothetical protein